MNEQELRIELRVQKEYEVSKLFLEDGGDINTLNLSIPILMEEECWEEVEGIKRAMFEYLSGKHITVNSYPHMIEVFNWIRDVSEDELNDDELNDDDDSVE